MLIKRPDDVLPSEITPESVYHSRRQFMRGGATLAAGAALVACEPAESGVSPAVQAASDFSAAASATPAALDYAKAPADGSSGFNTTETPTPFTDVIRYNNFYEFGTDKGDPARYGHKLTTTPWTVAVSGEVGKPGRYDFDDLIKPHQLQERIYRLRCVEAWSMVIPWVGIPLADVIKRMEPTGDAKYVAFETLKRPAEMRGQRSRTGSIDWPYEEGLRMDEAMHPLTLLAVGLYGKELLPQNGAPIRLVVPWKYGFKSIKSIVKIKLTKRKPATSWSQIAPREYGFYANVNPDVDHPRWSQASERRLPSTLFAPNRIDTQPFNGYAEQVASLYSGMDLRRNY